MHPKTSRFAFDTPARRSEVLDNYADRFTENSMAKRLAKTDSPQLHSPIHSGSSAECMLEVAERPLQDKLIRQQEERGSDEPPTIIPFPSEKAQAADDQPNPQTKREIQEDGVYASPAQRWWVSRARRQAAGKSRRKRDWDRFTFRDPRDKSTPQERLEREKANHRRAKLLSGQHTQLPDTAAKIIPFPSEQSQAADELAAPSSGT